MLPSAGTCKNGSIGFIDVLLDSDNISRFLTNLDMVQKSILSGQDTLETLKGSFG